MTRWFFVAIALCASACPGKEAPVPVGGAGGSAGPGSAGGTPAATTCESIRPRVEQLYRTEAEQKEPKRVEEAVSDNTAMVMGDCARDPAKVAPCVARVATVAELEQQCLIPLDERGTEGEALP